MKLLVSACLLGVACRYNGTSKPNADVLALLDEHTLIPVCPEQLGGMATPRLPSERQGDKVCNVAGQDVTEDYEKGAREALRLGHLCGCTGAILKARSPACGSGEIYDGTFLNVLTQGDGVAAELLRKEGFFIVDEEHLDALKTNRE